MRISSPSCSVWSRRKRPVRSSYVPQDNRRPHLPGPGATFPPSGDAGLLRHLDALVVCQPEVLQPRVHLDCRDSQPDRQSGLAVRSGRAVGRQVGMRRQARCRGRWRGRRRRRHWRRRSHSRRTPARQAGNHTPSGRSDGEFRARHPPAMAATCAAAGRCSALGLPAATVSPIAAAA